MTALVTAVNEELHGRGPAPGPGTLHRGMLELMPPRWASGVRRLPSGSDALYLPTCLGNRQEAGLGARRLLHCLAGHKLWTKLRPGVFEFLEVG